MSLRITPDGAAPSPYSRWTRDRIARLGFLVGLGWSARAVAGDPLVASTSANVYRQAHRFGLAFDEASSLRLPAAAQDRFAAAATKRGMTRDALIRTLLVVAGSDDTLIDNILDDQS